MTETKQVRSTLPVAPDQTQTVGAGISRLLAAFAKKYPQENPDGSIRYVFCGSSVYGPLALADRFEPVNDWEGTPSFASQVLISPEAGRGFQMVLRKIGDLDLIPGPRLPELEQNAIQDIHLSEFPGLLEILRMAPSTEAAPNPGTGADWVERPHCDLRWTVVRIQAADTKVYVLGPVASLCAAVAKSLSESSKNTESHDRRLQDVLGLSLACRSLLTDDQVFSEAAKYLFWGTSQKWLIIPDNNASYREEHRQLFEGIIARHPDASLLDHCRHPRRHAIAVLKLLQDFKTQESKSAIVAMLNALPFELESISPDAFSPENQATAEECLFPRPDLWPPYVAGLEPAKQRAGLREMIVAAINANRDLLAALPGIKFSVFPRHEALEALSKVCEESIVPELIVFRRVVSLDPVGLSAFSALYGSQVLEEKSLRSFVTSALCAVPDETFSEDIWALSALASELIDSETMTEISLDERRRRLRAAIV